MKKNYIIILSVLAISIAACKKEASNVPRPEVNFGAKALITVNNRDGIDTSALITIGTHDQVSLMNLSKNASGFQWDFGNGNTSNEESPSLSFPTSGEYNVTLTANDESGKSVRKSRNFKVLDRVLKLVRITGLNFNSNFNISPNWPSDKMANIQATIMRIGETDYPVSENNDYKGSTIYQSSLSNTQGNINAAIEIPVQQKTIIDFKTLRDGKYGINLYASDNASKYLISSSWGSGVGYNYQGDIKSRNFVITSGFNGNRIELIGVFE